MQLTPIRRNNNLGFWGEAVGAVASSLFAKDGKGGMFGTDAVGGGGAGGNSNINNVITQVSPVFQTQISPNISPIFQQQQSANVAAGENIKMPESSGGGYSTMPMSASTSQNAPATFTATPTMDVKQTFPATVPASVPAPVDNYAPFADTQISPVYQTQIPKKEFEYMPWILGGLALIVFVKLVR